MGLAKQAMTYGFLPSELERQKAEMMKYIEKAYLERDKTESNRLASACVYHFLNQSPLLDAEQTLKLYQQLLETITVKEVNEIGKDWITDENRVVVVTGPDKETAPLPTEEEFEKMFERIKNMEVTPYEDKVGDAPLLSADLQPNGIAKETYFESVDVHELELENGVKVVLKSTDFKNDEILMTAFSPGGHSLYSDVEYQTASNADVIVAQGGVGEFDFLALGKKLAGKTVNVGPYIGETYEGFSGNASPDDLETMLQLVYLYFTAPRKDAEALQSFVTRQKSILQNMGADPQYYYATVRENVRYNNHPRRQALPSIEEMDALDLDRAMEIYKDRFSDASDFTFVFVGNFELEGIKPLLTTYLGNLPATDREESWRDVGADLVKGVIDSTVVRGQAPKARVDITFHGEFDYFDGQERYDFGAMLRVLRIKLRESMREDKGGVYGVSLQGSNSPYPDPTYRINLSFTCDP